jgi:hypothetical protein
MFEKRTISTGSNLGQTNEGTDYASTPDTSENSPKLINISWTGDGDCKREQEAARGWGCAILNAPQ